MAQLPGAARVKQYVAVAGQTVFIYDFLIYHNDEIIVQNGSEVLTLTTDYTVQDAGEEVGGTITLTAGASLDALITLTGNSMIERDTVFTDGGSYLASAINGEYNKLDNITSEITTDQSNNFKLAVYDPTVSTTMPSPTARRALVWDAAGSSLENTVYDPDLANAQTEADVILCHQAVVDAEAAAADSQDSADASAASAVDSADSADESAASAVESAASAASINLTDLASDIIPDGDETRNLGSSTRKWDDVYANKFVADRRFETEGGACKMVSTGRIVGADGAFNVAATTGNTTIAGTLTVNGEIIGPNSISSSYTYTVVSGVSGGSYIAAAWGTRPINTEEHDDIGITLAANKLTIPGGTYMYHLTFVSFNVGAQMWSVYNDTDAVELGSGYGTYAGIDGNASSGGSGIFTLPASKDVLIRMLAGQNQPTDGMGKDSLHAPYLRLTLTQL